MEAFVNRVGEQRPIVVAEIVVTGEAGRDGVTFSCPSYRIIETPLPPENGHSCVFDCRRQHLGGGVGGRYHVPQYKGLALPTPMDKMQEDGCKTRI